MRKKYIILFLLAFPAVLLQYKYIELNRWVKDGIIHDRVTVHGFSVGGMTRDEAMVLLSDTYQPDLEKKYIRFVTGEKEYTRLYFKDADAFYDFTEAADAAYQYGRSKGTRVKARFSKKHYAVNTPPQYNFNHEKLNKFIVAINEKSKTEAVNASLSYANGSITVIPGKYGRTFETKSVYERALPFLTGQTSGEVELGFTPVKPQYTSDDITFPVSCLGSFSTILQNPKDEPRIKNIRTAASRVHNQTVYPGEIFSTSKHIASGKPDSGYEKAVVLVNGIPQEDFGGGDYFYLKFKNNTSYPLLVVSEIQNGKLEISLHGYEKRPPGRSLVFSAELTETVKPNPQQIKKDPAIPSGETWVYTEAQDGYKYDLYKQIFMNGQLKGREKVNTSVYKPVQGVVGVSEF
jgi:vancomycin resistance protein YoaR